MRYSSFALMALISTVIAMPTPQDSFGEAETQGDGPAPVDSGLFPCGQAYYAPDQYICYGDFLCPILDGSPTLQCGGACYLESLYSCDGDVLVSLSENNVTDDGGETATIDGEDPTQTGADLSEPTSSGVLFGDDDTSSSSGSSSDSSSSSSSDSDSDSPSANDDSSSFPSSSSDSGSGSVEKRDPRAPCRKYFRQPGRRC